MAEGEIWNCHRWDAGAVFCAKAPLQTSGISSDKAIRMGLTRDMDLFFRDTTPFFMTRTSKVANPWYSGGALLGTLYERVKRGRKGDLKRPVKVIGVFDVGAEEGHELEEYISDLLTGEKIVSHTGV